MMAAMRSIRSALVQAGAALRWYVRQATGEGKWDAYVSHCVEHDEEPMARAEFERRRADWRERGAGARCC